MNEHRIEGIPNAQITARAHEQANGSYTLRVRAIRIVGEAARSDEGSTDTAEWGVGLYPTEREAMADLTSQDCQDQIRGIVTHWLGALGHVSRLH